MVWMTTAMFNIIQLTIVKPLLRKLPVKMAKVVLIVSVVCVGNVV